MASKPVVLDTKSKRLSWIRFRSKKDKSQKLDAASELPLLRTSDPLNSDIRDVENVLQSAHKHPSPGEEATKLDGASACPPKPVDLSKGELAILPDPWRRLPVEIWQQIADTLNPASAASLAFSCKQVLHVLGTQYLTNLNEDSKFMRKEKCSFLINYDRCYPSHQLCFECATFHRRFPNSWKIGAHSGGGFAGLTSESYLPFCSAQSMSRAGFYGPTYGEPLPEFEGAPGQLKWKHSMESRCVDGRVMIRFDSSKTILSANTYLEELHTWSTEHQNAPATTSLCKHFDAQLAAMLKCATSHYPKFSAIPPKLCNDCGTLTRCTSCATEYQVRWRRNARGWNVLEVLRWSDLGDCRTPWSREWQAAITPDPSAGALKLFDLEGLPNVRDRYEADAGRHFKEMTVKTLTERLAKDLRLRLYDEE